MALMAKRKEVHREVAWTVIRKTSEHLPVRVELGGGDWIDLSLGEAERLGVELIKASRRKSPSPPPPRPGKRRRH